MAPVRYKDHTDEALWSLWKLVKDARAGGELCERHFYAVLAFFSHKVRNDRDAEDLAQKTWLALSESDKTPDVVRAYIFGVARHVLIHFINKRGKDPVDPTTQSMAEVDPGHGLATLAMKSRERERLVIALRSLPIDDQILLMLYYWQEMSGSELAEVLDVPEPTVRGRIAAAKRRLEKALDSPPGSGASQTMRGMGTWIEETRAIARKRLKPQS